MFWGLAAVCEEYFVPALNILCEELNVPEDVAGATFMAAGASSPEMFTSFIALFVDHSTLGVGTVVGSEIFNHMMICAGSVMYSTNGVLYLDKYVFTRDAAAYFFSLIVLLWAIKGNLIHAFSHMFASGVENECLNVTIWHALGLIVLYILYVLVSSNFQAVLRKYQLVHFNPPLEEQERQQELELELGRLEDGSLPPEGGDRELSNHEVQLALESGADEDEEKDQSVLLGKSPSSKSVLERAPSGDSIRAPRCSSLGVLNTSSIDVPRKLSNYSYRSKYANIPEEGQIIRAPRSSSLGTLNPSLPPNPNVIQLQRNPSSYTYRSFLGNVPTGDNHSNSPRGRSKSSGDQSERQIAKSNFIKDQAMFAWRLTQMHYQDPYSDTVLERPEHPILGPAVRGYHACLRALGSEASREEMSVMEVSQRVLSGYLFLKSHFYKMRCCPVVKSWRLRYFTVDEHGLHSRKFREGAQRGPQIEMIDLQTCRSVEVVDRDQGLFELKRNGSASYFDNEDFDRPYQFVATSAELMDAMVKRIADHIKRAKARTREQQLQFNKEASIAMEGEFHLGDEGENHVTLLDAPDYEYGSPSGMLSTSWHYFLFPLKFLLHYTLPDVMVKGGRKKYIRCLFVSIFWLALQSFAMIKCCDGLGEWIGTSPTVMGLTLSAVGTSFPNLWSSMLVARQGFGNMAVGNAFGSNTFNICVALGLPWFVLVLISGQPYQKMRDDGIAFMVTLLTSILVLFYLLVMAYGWRIHYWMSYVFVATYLAVMVYAVIHG